MPKTADNDLSDSCIPAFFDRNNLILFSEWAGVARFDIAWFVNGRGGEFLLLEEVSKQIVSRPWWWRVT